MVIHHGLYRDHHARIHNVKQRRQDVVNAAKIIKRGPGFAEDDLEVGDALRGLREQKNGRRRGLRPLPGRSRKKI